MPSYALLALVGFLSIISLRRPKPEPDLFCLASSVLFFGYVLARAILSPVPYYARSDIYSVLGALVIYFYVARVLVAPKPRMWILICLLLLAVVHVAIGATQFRNGNNFMPISFLQRFDYGRRASGFYVCPNHLAGLLEVLGIFGLSIVCWSRWPVWGKLLVGYAAAVCYVGVALTASRGGYLSTIGSVCVFVCLSLVVLRQAGSALFWRLSVISLIAVVALSLTTVLLIGKSHFLAGRAGRVFETTNIRIDLWQAAIKQWKVSPVIGTGSGTYRFYGRQFRVERMQLDPMQVHNDYLHLLAEYGLAAAALFIVFLVLHLRRGLIDFHRLGPKRVPFASQLLSNGLALNLSAIAAVAAYLIHSVFDFNLHIPANVLLMAFVFGILANSGMQKEPTPSRVKMPALFWQIPLPLLGLILAIQCFRLLPGEYFAERSRVALRDYHPASSILFALKGLASERGNPNLYYYLGRARMLQGQAMSNPTAAQSFYRSALMAFEAARSLAPTDETFIIELAHAYDALERFSEAEWMYAAATALDPRAVYIKKSYAGHVDRWSKAGALAPSSPETRSAPEKR